MDLLTTRVSKASKDAMWRAIEDVDNYPNWGDDARKNSPEYQKNHHISAKVVSREGNIAICEMVELVAGRRQNNRYKVTFYPKDKFEAELIGGTAMDLGSMFQVLTLTETAQGTRVDWNYHMTAKTLRMKILVGLAGRRAVQPVLDEYCRQLAEYAEAHP
jgi:hypothetical protein